MITLHPGETIVFETRRHWLPIAVEGIVLLIFALIPLALLVLPHVFPPEIQAVVARSRDLFFFGVSAWILFLWVVFFIAWTNYYLDIFIITEKRIIDIEQIGLFSRDVAESRLENVEDIRVQITGVVPSLLDFGNLHIQTAGVQREFLVSDIPEPDRVRDIIAKQHDLATQNALRAA